VVWTAPGAFLNSLAEWRRSGDPIPVIWAHTWDDPMANIGVVKSARETDRGLEVEVEITDETPFAAQVKRLLEQRRVTEWSFAYDVVTERTGADGANELLELDLIELGPCLRGANPETGTLSHELMGVKSVQAMLAREAKQHRTEDYTRRLDALSPAPTPRKSRPKVPVPGAIDTATFIRTEYTLAKLQREEREAMASARDRDNELREQNFSDAELQSLTPAHGGMEVEPPTDLGETYRLPVYEVQSAWGDTREQDA
jgi:HK97 family phage prohead protease